MELFNLLAKLTLDTNDFDKGIDQAEKDLKSIEAPDTKLELDTNEFDTGLETSQAYSEGFGKNVGSVFSELKGVIVASGVALSITGIVNGLKEAVNLTAETADGIEKGAAKLGISQKAYQEWDHALKQSGSSIDVVKKGIMQFQAAIKSADPATPFADAEDQVDGLADKTAGLSEDAYKALRELGLLSRMQAGEFKNAEELMNASLLALAGYQGSTEERGLLTRALFGKGGDELNALLNEGEEGVKSLLTEASDLGLIMTDEEIANATAYGDAVDNLNAELAAIKTAFVQDIIPVLTEATKWLTDFLAQLNPRLQTSSIFDVFEQINAKAIVAGLQVDEATAEAEDLIKKLQEMGNYWTLDEEGKMTWDALASRALELFPQLSNYIDTDGKKIQGNTKDIIANVKAWALLEKQRILSTAMEEKQKAVAEQLTQAYEKGAAARAKEAEAEGKRQTVIKKLNDELKSAGMETISTDATIEEMSKAQSALLDFYGDDESAQVRIGLIGKEWGEVRTEAGKLRTEADKLKEDANSAKDSLAEEQRYLMEEMGYTEDQIKEITSDLDAYIKKLNETPSDVYTTFHTEYDDRGYDHSYAIGSAYIPYDQMALLHRGERVLTATENRQESSSSIDYSALEDRISAAIRAGMDGVTVNSYLNGKAITDEVNRNTITDVKNRRFRS